MEYKQNGALVSLLCIFAIFFVLGLRFEATESKTEMQIIAKTAIVPQDMIQRFRFEAGEKKTKKQITGLSASRVLVADAPAAPKTATVPPNAPLHCTEAGLKKRSKTVVLTTANAAFVDITKNMLESIRRTKTCPNILIIAEDEQSYKSLSQMVQSYPGLRVEKTHLGMSPSIKLKFETVLYNQFVAKRPQYVLRQLEQGYDVLFADADTFWFRDPFRDFEGNFDVAMHNEHSNSDFAFCDGFAYYKATPNALRLVMEWVRVLQTSRGARLDQKVLNELLSTRLIPGLKIRTLDPENYPDGKKFFWTPGWREKHSNTTVLHMTFIYGADNKIQKLKEFGWWLF